MQYIPEDSVVQVTMVRLVERAQHQRFHLRPHGLKCLIPAKAEGLLDEVKYRLPRSLGAVTSERFVMTDW